MRGVRGVGGGVVCGVCEELGKGDAGTILGTVDGGATWQRQNSRSSMDLLALAFVNCTWGWAAGKVSSRAAAVGAPARLLHTTDGGGFWSVRVLEEAPSAAVHTLFFLNPEMGWAAGDHGAVMHTQDGGESWTSLAPCTEHAVFGISIDEVSGNGFSVGESGATCRSRDRGLTWSVQGELSGYFRRTAPELPPLPKGVELSRAPPEEAASGDAVVDQAWFLPLMATALLLAGVAGIGAGVWAARGCRRAGMHPHPRPVSHVHEQHGRYKNSLIGSRTPESDTKALLPGGFSIASTPSGDTLRASHGILASSLKIATSSPQSLDRVTKPLYDGHKVGKEGAYIGQAT
ncbi:hypothetical protein CYMTET_19599 [Cymbomonas tetramitiformis]|uniref:Photosynthesis system II assembly factor Ycf48/Hcf136-like domain-containing protein n=1 Tax=Cymbomonas tetramitiformis TaxID=36881 RepID=A0AAE0G5P2_9CHLO|nr:hypothetical protein CYMTET_19599 [Cymbomonas tetramitiformis]